MGLSFLSPILGASAVIVNPDGKLTYLGTLGGLASHAYGINDAGQVVGVSDTAAGQQQAFITGPNGAGIRSLGTLGGSLTEPHDINESGQVVGRQRLLQESGTLLSPVLMGWA